MSYDEQLEFAEPADDLALDKLSLFSPPIIVSSSSYYHQQPRQNDSPLSTLGHLKNYLRGHHHDASAESARKEYPEHTIRLHSEGRGSSSHQQQQTVTAYGNGAADSLQLEGKTDATFDPSFKTANVKVRDAEGCSCTEGKCIRAKGTLQANYAVDIKVSLPRVSDYSDLNTSQKKRFQTAVNTILAPHEQKHVAAFRKYRGKTSRPFDFTTCEDELDGQVQAMFDAEEATRRQTVQDESDALDPFFFEFDL
ncbi:MAG TPA: hypothetical protein VJP79_06835 [Nitrososphaera sp.]|nr:hypothetical protein [Nitrososphaera sp.]